MLSLWQLSEHSDCVLPIENQSLMDICQIIQTTEQKSSQKGRGTVQVHTATRCYRTQLFYASI